MSDFLLVREPPWRRVHISIWSSHSALCIFHEQVPRFYLCGDLHLAIFVPASFREWRVAECCFSPGWHPSVGPARLCSAISFLFDDSLPHFFFLPPQRNWSGSWSWPSTCWGHRDSASLRYEWRCWVECWLSKFFEWLGKRWIISIIIFVSRSIGSVGLFSSAISQASALLLRLDYEIRRVWCYDVFGRELKPRLITIIQPCQAPSPFITPLSLS